MKINMSPIEHKSSKLDQLIVKFHAKYYFKKFFLLILEKIKETLTPKNAAITATIR